MVGGHAVNLWASYYAPRGDRELARFAPFVSKDGDIFVRDKSLAMAIAASAGWKFRSNPEPRSPVLGRIYLEKNGRELTIDVLRSVRGLTSADLNITEAIEFKDGRRYSVPAPEVMLKAKIANLATITQVDRPDLRHVSILAICCRHYLADACVAVQTGAISERDAVKRFMSAVAIIRSSDARAMDRRHGLNLDSAMPGKSMLPDLAKLPRIGAFYDHQIARNGPRYSV